MRNQNWLIVIAIFYAFLVACESTSSVQVDHDGVSNLTLSELLSNAESFDRQRVVISGYLKIEFENTNIFTTKSAANDFDDDQCIALLVPQESFQLYSSKFDNKHGEVIGEFRKTICEEGDICSWYCGSSGLLVEEIR